MYQFAILIGVYSYSIFFLGLFGLLDRHLVLTSSMVCLLILIGVLYRSGPHKKISNLVSFMQKATRFEKIVVILILVQVLVNLIGALGPELAFDSLWYHLTLPKIFIMQGKISYLPGGNFYYSVMPKLVEMLYIPALIFGNEIFAKLIHFLFGMASLLALYRLSRKFTSIKYSLIAVLILYSNLVVDWLSITSYVDLGRMFFEVLSLYYILDFIKSKKTKELIIAAVMLGLAVSTKVISGIDIFAFVLLILLFTKSIKSCVLFALVATCVPLPWLVFAYINTGNPFYPFLSNAVQISGKISLYNLVNFIHSPDPISPIYLVTFPLIMVVFKKFNASEKVVGVYCLTMFVVWFLTPQIGGGRFIAAYLPGFSLLVIILVNHLKSSVYKNYFLLVVILVSLISIFYRFAANYKYLSVIMGVQSKSQFLSKNLNFSFGDFYDVDGYFKAHIKSRDRVLVYGIHNLYYVDFNFIDGAWYKKGEKIDYIFVRGRLPNMFGSLKPVYENNLTNVKLYKAK